MTSSILFIVIFHTCKAKGKGDNDMVIVSTSSASQQKKKKRKKREEEINGAYLQGPTSTPLAFVLAFVLYCHHIEAHDNKQHSYSFGDGSECKRRWVGRGPAG